MSAASRNALDAGYAVLERGGTSVEAVEAAVVVMEDDETFDAGRGSFLTRDGRVQLDALLMNGENLRTGGVACVEQLPQPHQGRAPGAGARARMCTLSASARSALRAQHGMRALRQHGPGHSARAEAPVRRAGGGVEGPEGHDVLGRAAGGRTAATDPMLSHDTVGAVALDAHGNLAAGTSTGGTLNKAPGRVGDSSLIGCGCYADNLSAAVSLTGWGEPIMKLVLGKWAVDRVPAGELRTRRPAAIAYLYDRLGGHGGVILLGPDGELGLAHNTPRMAWGLATPAGQSVGAHRDELAAQA